MNFDLSAAYRSCIEIFYSFKKLFSNINQQYAKVSVYPIRFRLMTAHSQLKN